MTQSRQVYVYNPKR